MLLTHVIHRKHAQCGINSAVIRLLHTSRAICMWCDPFYEYHILVVERVSKFVIDSKFVTLNWKCIFDVHFLSRDMRKEGLHKH